MPQDSPLSITASVTGILTFLYAILAGAFSYLYLLQTFNNSEVDIERFYEAFGACALETSLVQQSIAESKKWLQAQQQRSADDGAATGFFLDPKPIDRLYDYIRTVEIELQLQAAKVVKPAPTYNLMQRISGRGRWMSRSKELEASLSKREALTARLLVIQMSLFLAYVSLSCVFCLLTIAETNRIDVILASCRRNQRSLRSLMRN